MLFVELRFFLFFLIAFAVYWGLRKNRSRKLWLLGCSYLFYGAWDWRFLTLVIFSTMIDQFVGLKIAQNEDPRRRWRWLLVSLVGQLSLLGYFKYFNFFIDSAADFAELLGLPASRRTLEIILPVGISFYTFQTLSYTLDIYRRRLQPARTWLDFYLFVAFFPQLVAGPILRAAGFLPQLLTSRSFPPPERIRAFLVLFLVGFFKKACISDNLAPHVDRYFADPSAFDAASAWAAVLFYAVQIYCDFSGYSDMAIALAGLLGYEMILNFDAPYFAVNITEFWRRWHISLSTWLRDYLYIPLGGSHGSKLFTYRNLMLTMLLGGLWHGAAWTFVIWGGLHGVALIFHKEWTALVRDRPAVRQVFHYLGPFLTFYWVCVTWIFFRAAGLSDAVTALRSFVLLQDTGAASLGVNALAVMAPLAALHWLARYRATLESWYQSAPPMAFAAAYGACFAFAVALVPMDHRPFIYFQF